MVDYGDEWRDTHPPAGPDSPLSPLFWTQPASGGAILRGFSAAHMGGGLLAACGMLAWLAVAPMTSGVMLVAALGAVVAGAGLLAFELGRGGPQSALAARVILPLVDLVVGCAALWALGMQGYTPLLFLVPVCVATLLFSWRGGLVVAALALVAFAALSTFRLGSALEAWAPETIALAAVMALLVLCQGVYVSRLSGHVAALREQITLLERERDLRTAEQHRLLETVSLLEDARGRVERERAQLHGQIMDVASVARRVTAGDHAAAQSLRPGMYGPVDVLAGALARLTQQVGAVSSLRMHVRAQQRTLDALSATMSGQAQLLDTADAALRELGDEANRLVAEVQVVERGSGELPGVDRHALFRALRGVEQRAIAQASNTALLSARMTQLRERQTELESERRRLDQLTAAARAFETSGIISTSASTPVAAASSGPIPSRSDVFAASDVLPRDAQQPQSPSWPRIEIAEIPGSTPQ